MDNKGTITLNGKTHNIIDISEDKKGITFIVGDNDNVSPLPRIKSSIINIINNLR